MVMVFVEARSKPSAHNFNIRGDIFSVAKNNPIIAHLTFAIDTLHISRSINQSLLPL
jgi:hypothetical protein